MEDCIFCKIVNKEIPTEFLFETENLVVFKDINPVAPTHLLVVTKEHFSSLNTLDDKELLGDLLLCVKEVTKKYKITDYKLHVNTGRAAGQVVDHIHFHIISQTPIA